ncbi:glycosyltransferase [Limosilactobacillus fermentum]|uniref:glycosyltransferase n=1 Tax=Limosilactobacillus fermentum TaxID=1613 RepID=UPI003BA00F1A
MAETIAGLMTSYNEPIEYLKASVESMLNQTYRLTELVIVLDDPTNQAAKDYLESMDDSRITVLKNEKNLGLALALNRGLGVIKSDYVARMDADDIAHLDRLEKQIRYLLDNHLDFVASNVNDMNEAGQMLGTGTKYPTTDRKIKKYLKYGDPMPHPSWLVKKVVYDQLGGYHDILSCEDYEFVIRAAQVDVNFGLVSEPLINYRINAKGITQTNKARQMVISEWSQEQYRNKVSVNVDDLNRYLESDRAKEVSYSRLRRIYYKIRRKLIR